MHSAGVRARACALYAAALRATRAVPSPLVRRKHRENVRDIFRLYAHASFAAQAPALLADGAWRGRRLPGAAAVRLGAGAEPSAPRAPRASQHLSVAPVTAGARALATYSSVMAMSPEWLELMFRKAELADDDGV
jgi:hypothetical protein